MKDVQESLEKALIRDGWVLGTNTFIRTGNPFEWIDGDSSTMKVIKQYSGVISLVKWLLRFDEIYSTPEDLRLDEYEKVKNLYIDKLQSAFDFYAPFFPKADFHKIAIEGLAKVRTTDFCFIKKFANYLPSDGISHVDIGPGLCSHSVYSLSEFNSKYIALEAIPYTYQVQRYFLRYVSQFWPYYLDVVECENFFLPQDYITNEINENKKYKIIHLPSWNFQLLSSNSIDLITATFMLNEISEAGLLWIIANSTQVLKKGGYFYIRDSEKFKPNRHNINYDKLLEIAGFELVKRLNVQNRVNFHGIPRLYHKKTEISYTYKHLLDKCLGHFFTKSMDMKSLDIDEIKL